MIRKRDRVLAWIACLVFLCLAQGKPPSDSVRAHATSPKRAKMPVRAKKTPKKGASDYEIKQVKRTGPKTKPQPDTTQEPELRHIEWLVGDTSVTVSAKFDRVPWRYLAYSLENSDRIVLDCFQTRLGAELPGQKPPAPVRSAKLKAQTIDPDIQLARLILYTSQAVAFHVVERADQLDLVIQWNTKSQQAQQSKKKRRRIAYVSAGAAAVVGGVVAYIATRPPVPGSDEIPPPDMPLPDAN